MSGVASVAWDEQGFGGICPVQATGRGRLPDGREVRVYFRARGQAWSVSVWLVVEGERLDDWGLPDRLENAEYFERWGDDEYAAGWMPWDLAEQLATVAFALLAWRMVTP